MSQYEFNSEGLYVCKVCGAGLEPGHSVVCKDTEPPTPEPLLNTDGFDLTVGFKLLHANERDD